jgi:phosphotransferase system  glucose/maltose/N-acetylglucosamine-specific IIC component
MNTCCRPSPLHFLRRVLVGLLIAVAVATLFGFIVEHLWNALMPGLFHLPLLTWLQAIGMVLLARLLVGHVGHGHHRGGGPWKRGPFGGWHDRHQFRDWFEGEGREAFQAWKTKEGQA